MRPLFRGFGLPVTLLAAGCGHSPATTFLALDPVPPTSAIVAYRGPMVRVPFLHVPVTLDRPEFVRQVAETVKISDFDRWAAPLGLLARNTLIQNLVTRLPAGSVLPPDSGATVPEVRVEVTVLAFRHEGSEAVMDVSYRLVRPAIGRAAAPAAVPQLATLRTAVANYTPTAQAQGWSRLLGLLSDRLAVQLTEFR